MAVAVSVSPARVSTSESMFWLFQSLLLIFRGGSGNEVSQGHIPPLVVNGVLGESVTLPLKFPVEEKVHMITWSLNAITLAVINLQESEKPQVLVPNKGWKERLTFTQSYSLKFTNVIMTDAGFYRAQINTENSQMLSSYTLRIFRPLSNLQVIHHSQLSGNSTCEIDLICSVDPNETVSFRWQVSGNVSLRGPNLTTSWDPKESSEQYYTCIAENPISNLSFSVTAQSLCTGVLTKENRHRVDPWVILAVLLLLLLFITGCIVAYIVPVWRRRSGSLRMHSQQTQHTGESFQPIEYTAVSPGSTVYAQVIYPNRETEISIPTKEDSVTIYTTINHSKETKTISTRETALNDIK